MHVIDRHFGIHDQIISAQHGTAWGCWSGDCLVAVVTRITDEQASRILSSMLSGACCTYSGMDFDTIMAGGECLRQGL